MKTLNLSKECEMTEADLDDDSCHCVGFSRSFPVKITVMDTLVAKLYQLISLQLREWSVVTIGTADSRMKF